MATNEESGASGVNQFSLKLLKSRKYQYKAGDWVIYRMAKTSTHPGPRAQQVSPASAGDQYRYFVEKYWIVAEVKPDGQLLIKTRRGKQHEITIDDPCLRRASFFEKLFLAHRFPPVKLSTQPTNQSEPDNSSPKT